MSYKKIEGCEILKCHGLLGFCFTHHFEVLGLTQNPVDLKTLSFHAM